MRQYELTLTDLGVFLLQNHCYFFVDVAVVARHPGLAAKDKRWPSSTSLDWLAVIEYACCLRQK